MVRKLNVPLPPGWDRVPGDKPDAPETFVRKESPEPGALQVSVQLGSTGEASAGPTSEQLVDVARNLAERDGGRLVSSESGECALGRFGSATTTSEEMPHVKVWVLTNGSDAVLATHMAAKAPEQVELNQADQIVRRLTIEIDEQA
jgi:hypothetical protein